MIKLYGYNVCYYIAEFPSSGKQNITLRPLYKSKEEAEKHKELHLKMFLERANKAVKSGNSICTPDETCPLIITVIDFELKEQDEDN